MKKENNKKTSEVKLQADFYERSQEKIGGLMFSPVVKQSIIKLITYK